MRYDGHRAEDNGRPTCGPSRGKTNGKVLSMRGRGRTAVQDGLAGGLIPEVLGSSDNGTGGKKVSTVKELFNLVGRRALVTGGGRGLGEAMAWALAEAGAEVVVASRHLDSCAEVAGAIHDATGVRTLALELDVSQEPSVSAAVRRVEDELGAVDILINNSGTSWGTPFEEMPLDKWEKVMAVNVTGAFLMTRALIGGMRERKWGRVINVASIAGLYGVDARIMQATGYHASKGALIAMTRDLAVKYGPDQVTVNAIAPGFIPTKMSKGVLASAGALITQQVPLGRLGEPEDIKGLTVFLASEASRYVTGQVIALDGGTTAQ